MNYVAKKKEWPDKQNEMILEVLETMFTFHFSVT